MKPSLALRGVIGHIILFLYLFVPAGRWDYWQGWLYFSVSVGLTVTYLFLFRHKADLMQERIKPGPGIKWWDRIFFVFYLPLYCMIPILSAYDAGHAAWTNLPLNGGIYGLGYLLFVSGLSLVCWAMWTNPFFSSVVRIQNDRGHEVVDRGPYAYVRHPGYVGALIMMYGIPLCLGSLYALILSMAISVVVMIRTGLEDATLQNELPGYREYATDLPEPKRG